MLLCVVLCCKSNNYRFYLSHDKSRKSFSTVLNNNVKNLSTIHVKGANNLYTTKLYIILTRQRCIYSLQDKIVKNSDTPSPVHLDIVFKHLFSMNGSLHELVFLSVSGVITHEIRDFFEKPTAFGTNGNEDSTRTG